MENIEILINKFDILENEFTKTDERLSKLEKKETNPRALVIIVSIISILGFILSVTGGWVAASTKNALTEDRSKRNETELNTEVVHYDALNEFIANVGYLQKSVEELKEIVAPVIINQADIKNLVRRLDRMEEFLNTYRIKYRSGDLSDETGGFTDYENFIIEEE